MVIDKEHREFFPIAMSGPGWQLPEGYAPEAGVDEMILSGSLDTRGRQGSRTRCCVSSPAASPPNRSCTIIGRRCSSSKAT